MDVATLGCEPYDRSVSGLRRYRKSREVGASVRTCDLPVLTRSGAAACNSEPALPVEAMHPLVSLAKLVRVNIIDVTLL